MIFGVPATFVAVLAGAGLLVVGVIAFVRQLDKNEPIRQATIRAKRSAPITVTPSLPIARTIWDVPPALRPLTVDPLRTKRSRRGTAQ